MDLRRERKVERDGAAVTWDGRRANTIGNALSATVDSRVSWTTLTMRNAIIFWLWCMLVVVVCQTGRSVPDHVDTGTPEQRPCRAQESWATEAGCVVVVVVVVVVETYSRVTLVTVIRFKSTVKRLQELKLEIEHLQHLLELSRVKLMKDFDVWWSEQEHLAQAQAC